MNFKSVWRACLAGLLLVSAALSAALAAAPAANDPAVARAQSFLIARPALSQHGSGASYEVRDLLRDPDGSIHVRFDRRFNGLRVIGGDVVVHSDRSGAFARASLTLKRPVAVATRPALSQNAAALIAAKSGELAGVPELVVYAREAAPRLAYDALVLGTAPDGTPQELHLILDAANGQLLDSWNDVKNAAANGSQNGKTFFSGAVNLTSDLNNSTYSLSDPSRGGQYTINMQNRTSGGSIFTNSVNSWGDGTLSNTVTVGADAQYGAAVTWDFYKNVLSRNGVGNDGVGAMSRVHYSRSYNNAFWSDSCFCMSYGDGDGKTYLPFVALDVAGHEMTHGVTSRTANLTYSKESGGLNEATSDIMGTMVEYFAGNRNDTPDYLIGEKLYKTSGKALRYMYKPSQDSYSADCWYSSVGSLNVHYSSGVANHFFYLLAEGSTPANMPSSPVCNPADTRVASGGTNAAITGIGRDAATKIWFRALSVYMTSNTNYSGARAATISAATDLFGAGSSQVNAVTAAWNAVNVKQ